MRDQLHVQFFKNHPTAILDGEIYKFGESLNKISGICRSQKTLDDGKDLEFYWYDIADLELPFSERYNLMQEWSKELQLSEFDPERHLPGCCCRNPANVSAPARLP